MDETPEMKVVRDMNEAAARREYDRVRQHFHPNVELIVPGTRPDPGVYRGVDQLFRWMNAWYEDLFDPFEVEAVGMSQFNDHVVCEYQLRGRGRLSGVEVTERNASIHTVRGGVIVRVYSAATVEEATEVAKQESARSTGGTPPSQHR